MAGSSAPRPRREGISRAYLAVLIQRVMSVSSARRTVGGAPPSEVPYDKVWEVRW